MGFVFEVWDHFFNVIDVVVKFVNVLTSFTFFLIFVQDQYFLVVQMDIFFLFFGPLMYHKLLLYV